MTTFVHDQEYIQPAGDTSLTAPPNSPNFVFLNNTGAEGFAGQSGSTDYIVLGNAMVYGASPGGGIAWQPGDEIQITFQIFDPAASFTVAADPAIAPVEALRIIRHLRQYHHLGGLGGRGGIELAGRRHRRRFASGIHGRGQRPGGRDRAARAGDSGLWRQQRRSRWIECRLRRRRRGPAAVADDAAARVRSGLRALVGGAENVRRAKSRRPEAFPRLTTLPATLWRAAHPLAPREANFDRR
jgi:hypothetical protein